MPNRSQANQGDIFSYEVLEHFSNQEVLDYFDQIFSGFIDEEDQPEFYSIAQLFFAELIDQRQITVYKIIYETINFDDEPVQASGIALIPSHDEWVCEKSISFYAHGTIFNREGVNSRPASWGGEFMLSMMMAAVNTICVAPDYYGLGDGDGFHHHNMPKTNSYSTIDIIRATRNLCDILGISYNNKIINMGYSEGGAASMSVAKLIHEEHLQNEFKISMLGAGAGAYDMSETAYHFIMDNDYYSTPAYIMYLLATCQDIYGDLLEEGETISKYLKSPYDQLFIDNILSQNGNIYWMEDNWPTMFREDALMDIRTDPNHPFRRCLKEGNTYDWRNPYLTYLYYCTTDEQVPYTGSLKAIDKQRSYIPWWRFWERFRIQGIDLTLGGAINGHGACALPSITVQVLLMQNHLGLSCEYMGREAGAFSESNAGESSMVYASNEIDFLDYHRQKKIEKITGVNFMTGKTILASEHKTIPLDENGLYLFQLAYADGSGEMIWRLKAEPNFVSTTDYDPIRTNPMQDKTTLDLSLLNDDVKKIVILDKAGHQHLVINQGLNENEVIIQRTESMKDGDYVVEVHTASGQNFPLQLTVNSKLDELSEIKIFPNPTNDFINIETSGDIIEVVLFNVQGVEMLSGKSKKGASSLQLNVEDLPRGMYVAQIFNLSNNSSSIQNLVIQ
jgi:hypothetical protein